MPQLMVDIECGEDTCGACEMQDTTRDYCEIFQEFIEDDMRVGECLEAQDYAEYLIELGEDNNA